MAEANLADRIRLGDGSTLAFRLVEVAGRCITRPDRDDFADELAAMANGRGGTVVLGVDGRSREVLGIPLDDLDIVEGWACEICNDSVTPALDADIRKLTMENSAGHQVPLVRIDLARSLFVHRSPGGYFRRIGSSRREMSPEALARLMQERSYSRVIRFDETIVPGTRRSDLHFALTRRFTSSDTSDDTLRKLRIMANDDDDAEGLTIAGALLCTREPQRWLAHAYVQAVAYAGERTDGEYQTDSRDIGGPLDEQVAEALHFVRRNTLVRATKSMARSDRPQFGDRSVFEALVNAVAHRDYSMGGSRIRLHLFADRLELYVPGALANTLTPDSLHMRQASRNELIVSLLARCRAPTGVDRTRLMDRRGDGVPIIREECQRLAGRLPEYSVLDESELRLVIWSAH